ncbi:MAG TPA: L,D-transpeptidase family protein [Cytophagaceae bacterium]
MNSTSSLSFFFSCCIWILFSCKESKVHIDLDTNNTMPSIGIESTDSLSIADYFLLHPQDSFYKSLTFQFYKQRNFLLGWSNKGIFIPQAVMLLNNIDNANEDGLPVERYNNKALWDLYLRASDTSPGDFVEQAKLREDLDIALTIAFFNYSKDIWQGIICPKEASWFTDTKEVDYVNTLSKILNEENSSHPFESHKPLNKEYKALKNALMKYRTIAKEGGWPTIDWGETKKIMKGDTSSLIPAIRKTLFVMGDLPVYSVDSVYDNALEEAVKAFQKRHGLEEDGVIADKTIQAMSVTVSDRIKQIVINMERWRWIPAIEKGAYLLINIPEYALHVYNEDTLEWSMDIIVGKSATSTPIFNGNLQYVVFNPSWSVPNNIAVNEILPLQKKDNTYLQSHGLKMYFGYYSTVEVNPNEIEWEKLNEKNFNYRFVQPPGKDNPLGKVKFLFPNSYEVYLHDTNTQYLFERSERGFSHGCVRLSEPMKLAEYVLQRDSLWNEKEIKNLLDKGEEKYLKLKTPLPVYLVYFTTWQDQNGTLHFREDIYGHDKNLGETLFSLSNQQPL